MSTYINKCEHGDHPVVGVVHQGLLPGCGTGANRTPPTHPPLRDRWTARSRGEGRGVRVDTSNPRLRPQDLQDLDEVVRQGSRLRLGQWKQGR